MASSQPPIDKVILRPERTSSSCAQTIKSQANESTAVSTNRSNIRRKPSPYVRQHDLVTRLKTTLQAQKKIAAKSEDVPRDGVNGSNPSSRKRPFPFPNEVQSNACNPSLNENPSASLETGQVWEELSSFLPLLTFGEESDELLSNLLRWVVDQNHEFKTVNEIFSSWAIFLEKMLRNRHDLNGSERERPLSKRRKISTKREFHSEDKNSNHSSIDSTRNLPWSVILRLTIRMTRYVAKQVSYVVLVDSDNNTCDANDCTEDEAGCTENEETTVHPLFQSLDLVLADLHIMMRMRRSSEVPNVFVQDRMLTDWRVHPKYNNGRFVWGPSRHAFVKNAEAISALLEMKHMKVDVIEWKEKINSIVEILDACCVRRIPVAVEPCADSLLSDNSKSLSAEVVDEKMKSTSSLSNIARRHLLRLEQIQEQEIKLLRKQHAKPLEATITQNQCNPNTVRSISVQHTLANNAAGVMTSQEDEVDELEDAYRAALAFIEKNDGRGSSRKAIESRFDFLVKLLERYKDNDSGENNDNFNVHGAEAYLENLLCSLVNPSDPEVWIRFMNESHGKESAADLRRGRSMLVSFLVAIRSPGWKNALQRLCPSPLPSYLGFLSDREMQSPFSAKPKEEGNTFRSSMLLPIKSACSSTLPPRISELGLSLCIGDFLQKGAENEELHFHASKNNFGVSLFRNFGPFQQINSSNCDDLLQSISTPLPDVRELTQDLFDLTLRLAASEDGNDKNKPNSPSLAANTATESLKTLFQVLSDYSEWLTPNAIVSRYRFVLIQVIDSFKCIDFDKNSLFVSGLGIDVDDEGSWTKRAESLIETATSASVRGRILLYATQFMSMLATNQLRSAQSPGKTSSSRFVNNSHFYSCLQFRQISRFWNHVDKATKNSYSSNCLSRVFDNSFCSIILLSLSHRFSMIVANSSMATLHKSRHTMQNKSSKSILSLLTILCSVFDVFAEDDLINDCWHLGWAVMLLSLSANHFVFGVDFITNDEYSLEYFIDKSVLSNLASNLRKLYLSVWRKEPQPCRGKANILKSITQNDFIFYESNKVHHRGSKNTFILLPAFDTLVSSLVIFASRDSKNSSSWCQYASNILLRKYETAVFLNNNDHSVCESCLYANAEFTFVSLWIRHLVANMQKIILNHFVAFDGGKKIDKSTFDESTDQMLNRLMTPLLRTLHANILQQSNSALPYEERNCSECGISKEKGFISYIFVSLFREESEKFLNKPTPTKTRNWGVYKKCIEKLLLSTPACAIFTFPRTEGLSQHSADALECVWDQYGQCNLSNATFIMIAAALHVNGSVPHISSSHAAFTNRDASSAKLKQYYDAFSYRAKECIRKSLDFFKRQGDAEASLSDYNKTNSDFQVMVCSVRRGLSSQRAVVGLCWWEEIISHLLSESGDRICSTSSIMIENRKMRDIEKACSALEQDLSAISN